MARKSTIDRLSAEMRALIARLRADDGHTIDEIHAELAALGVRVSRAALGRYVQRIDAADPAAMVLVVDRLRREIATLRQEVSEGLRQLRDGRNAGLKAPLTS